MALPLAAIPSVPGIGQTLLVPPAGPTTTPATGTSSFAGMLADKLGSVQDLQQTADAAAQDVSTGRSSDLAGATVAVEKASIAIELTSAVRNKAVEAYQDIMRMQV